MSKNIQNDYHYEIGVFDDKFELVCEYVTSLPIIKGNGIVQDKLMDFIKKEHGSNIVVLYNKKEGALLKDNRPVIDIEVPTEPTLNYNK